MPVTEHIDVTDQMKRDLAEDGGIVVRGLFTPQQLTRVRQSFDYGIATQAHSTAWPMPVPRTSTSTITATRRTARCTWRRSRSWDWPIS
ncbi:hypothetical protein C1Y40_04775 [Mycobacterium talmoniae]|uniref:Uncharacterized protein n=1 Tax=Mycobacterium talmoniae TaxID=1858794 RepID=A0A2S8BEK9_9MYCO|nr:hypothetical protein C1Y40_04775 [Mycobacterium talmoniae]